MVAVPDQHVLGKPQITPENGKCKHEFSKIMKMFFIGIFQISIILQINIQTKLINATPDTNVLAKVYQLYMVLYQCASMLISHSHGIVDITVSAKTTSK